MHNVTIQNLHKELTSDGMEIEEQPNASSERNTAYHLQYLIDQCQKVNHQPKMLKGCEQKKNAVTNSKTK